MRVALVLGDHQYESHRQGSVSGEEIDALGMQKAFGRRGEVVSCDITTPNIISFRTRRREKLSYDLAIHFFVPTIKLAGARNVLYFHQFWEYRRHNLRDLCQEFDLVMSPGLGLCREVPGVYYFPLAVDPDLYQPVPPGEAMRCQVLFVGNFLERSVATYGRYLRPALDWDLAIYGSYWDEPEAKDYTAAWRGLLPVDAASRAYASAELSLCVHKKEFREHWHLVTSRAYHSLACERVVVSDSFAALEEAFPDGKGVVCTEGGDQCRDIIQHYLRNVRARELLAEAGKSWVLAHHTWDCRIAELMRELGCR